MHCKLSVLCEANTFSELHLLMVGLGLLHLLNLYLQLPDGKP